MGQTVKLRRSAVSGRVPVNSQLELGELSMNTTDGKIFLAKSGSGGPSIEEVIITNTQNTGSLDIVGSISGSFFTGSFIGDGSKLYNIPASGVTGLSLDKISNGASTASIGANGFNVNVNTSITGSLTATEFTGGGLGLTNVPFYITGSDVNGVNYGKTFTKLHFDDSTGLNVTESDPGTAFISIGSHFRDIFIDGSEILRATGSDAFEIKALGGIQISTSINDTNANGYTKELTFDITDFSSSIKDQFDIVTGSLSASGEGRTARLEVTSATSTWTFNHNLNEQYPSIIVFDSDGNVIIPQNIDAVSSTQLVVSFASPQTGVVSATVGGGLPTLSDEGSVLTVSGTTAVWKSNFVSGSEQINITGTTNYNVVTDRFESLELFTSSIDDTYATDEDVNELRGDLNLYTSSTDDKLDSLETESGSIRTTFNSYTSSNDITNTTQNDRLTSLETKSGSIEGDISTIDGRLDSIETESGSIRSTFNTYTSSNNTINSTQNNRLNLLETTSGSLINRINSLETTSGSHVSRLDSLETESGSIRIELNTYTSSNNTTNTTQNNRLSALETKSGSIEGDISTIDGRLDSIEIESGSIRSDFNVVTSSFDGRLDSLETESGSIRTTFNSYTSSNNTTNTSQNSRLTSLESATSSLSGDISTIDGRVDSLEIESGSIRSTFNTYTSSNNTTNTSQNSRLTSLETESGSIRIDFNIITGSFDGRLDSLETESGSIRGEFNTYTSSNNTTNTSQNSRLTSLESASGSIRGDFNGYTSSTDDRLDSLETTSGSHNTRIGDLESFETTVNTGLEFTGSNVTIKGDLLVKGTETRVNSTTVEISDNIISLNGSGAANAGIEVRDATSPGLLSGSLIWDGTNNYWKGGTKSSEQRLLTVLDTGSLVNRLDSLETTTGSLDGRVDSLETFSGSADSRLDSIESVTGSYITGYTETDTLDSVTDRGSTTTNDISVGAVTSSGIGQFAGAIRITETGTAQSILIGNQDSAGTNNPSIIMGVNGALRFGNGDSWLGEGGTFTEKAKLDGNGFTVGNTVTATSFVKTGGTSTQFLKADGSVDSSTYLTSHPTVVAASSSDNSGRTYIQDILLDGFGHITGITTATETVVNTDTNYYVTGATFGTGDGIITLTRNDGNTVTVDLDGRYLTSFDITTQTDPKYLRSDTNDEMSGTLKVYSVIGAADDVRTGIAHYDTTAQAAGVGGQLVLGYKYIGDTNYTEGAIIKMYKENGTSGEYGSGLKFQVRNNGVGLSTKMTLDPSGNLTVTGTFSASGYNNSNWDTAYGWGNHASAGYATLSGSNSFSNSYNEFGNGVGSVSNDGGWNGRVNVAGTQHARLDVVSVSDGIVTTMYSHTGNDAGKMGTMSNHPLKLIVNGSDQATLDSSGNLTVVGGLTSNGNILLTGTATTTNQARTIDFTGFDKEGTTDFSDRAYIQHTTNAGGHGGSVLVLSSQNDANDGIAFLTNASSYLKRNGYTIWDAGNDGAGSGLDADTLDGQQGTYYAAASSLSSYLPLAGGTMTGILTIQTSNDNQLLLQSTDTWAGIGFDDTNSSPDFIWYNGVHQTFAIGGGGSNVSGKKLHVDGGMSIGINADNTATPTNGLYIEGGAQINSLVKINGSTSGETLLEITGTSGQLFSIVDDLTGDIFNVSDATGIPILSVNAAGIVTVDDTLRVYGEVIAYASSDERLKENIKPISNAIEKIKTINGYEFDWNGLSNNNGHDVGVIAQEIEKVLPEVVITRDNGFKAVKYEKLTALLIQANKELIKLNEDLVLRVESLEKKLK